MGMTRWIGVAIGLITGGAGLVSCNSAANEQQSKLVATATSAPTSITAEHLSPEPSPGPAYVAEQAWQAGAGAYVLKMSLVRKMPGIGDSKTSKGKANAAGNLGTLYRGERVLLQANQGPLVEVILSDGQHGLMAPESLLLADGVQLVTILANQQLFARPDFLALNLGASLEAGSLLFKLRTKDRFAEVQNGAKQTVWCLADGLINAPREVEAAKLWIRAKGLQSEQAEGGAPIYQLMRQQFADTHLVQLLVAPSQGWPEAQASNSLGSAPAEQGQANLPAAPEQAASPDPEHEQTALPSPGPHGLQAP